MTILLGGSMITYEKLWQTLKERGLKKQELVDKYEFSKGLIDNLNHNRSITMLTLNDICFKLNIKPDDVITYIKDENNYNNF